MAKYPGCIRCPGITPTAMKLFKIILGKRKFKNIQDNNTCDSIIDKEGDRVIQCEKCCKKELDLCIDCIDKSSILVKTLNSLYRDVRWDQKIPIISNWDVVRVNESYIIRGVLNNKLIFIYS
mgnify:CR=1 FL=1